MASLDLLAGFVTAHPEVYQFLIRWQHVAGPACFFLRQLLNDMDLALLDPDIISAWMIEGDGDLLEEVEGAWMFKSWMPPSRPECLHN